MKCKSCGQKLTHFICWHCGADNEPLSSDAVLADVLDEWISDLETEDIFLLPKLLKKMKDFRVKHFR